MVVGGISVGSIMVAAISSITTIQQPGVSIRISGGLRFSLPLLSSVVSKSVVAESIVVVHMGEGVGSIRVSQWSIAISIAESIVVVHMGVGVGSIRVSQWSIAISITMS